MLGSRSSDGAANTPATAPSAAASPQPTAAIAPTWMPTRRASNGFAAAARSPRPVFVRAKNRPMIANATTETPITPSSHLRERDAADMNRRRRERPGQLPGVAAPDPRRQPVDREQQSDGENDDRDQWRSLHRPDQHLFDRHTAPERKDQRRREGGPERPAVLDQGPADERRERRQLSLREVEHARRTVNDDDPECEQPVDAPTRQTAHDVLHEVRHVALVNLVR